ncbi:30S ribosomal protein S4e [Candidatus Woesearchaeota archaeon]|jgi:small subunit ribosomal protein S4e|nr:30S ribosomal protein S4e [Candidatus Woesearchaeota archaeon]MBT5271918.1 30S ribosomal protein S4e [Candidatus Woesearchaeota archaeon]MBT6041030.1 30S ribosomal protein S4e [Candidatus Woesearchaeota archaeon]MBT6336206.1 30S ribosomal protein S4e [Candidatus Woesearchaeota archaeon]MBT7928027.1 30S ribosomal protein S4e [Candidatus Woesearchaeota archaeon]
MVKNHLKRLSVPKSWVIKRKKNVFVTRPMPGGQEMSFCLPLNVVLRDFIKIGKTTKEIKHILNHNDVLINGKRRTDVKTAFGFMDVLNINKLNESYRLLINSGGKLIATKIVDAEKNILLLKVLGKTKLKGGKIQINFTNGINLIVEKDDFKTQCVVVYDFVKKKISEIFNLEKGNAVYLTGGRYAGTVAKIESIKDKVLIFRTQDNEMFRTSAKYAFVVGKDKPVIKLLERESDK